MDKEFLEVALIKDGRLRQLDKMNGEGLSKDPGAGSLPILNGEDAHPHKRTQKKILTFKRQFNIRIS
jgi:hypothetical protein